MKAAFFTLGCKVNQYESRALGEELERAGYEIVDSGEEADVYVINSCTVTAESDRKTRQTVRRFRREHPEACVVLTGCFPQAFPEEASALTAADIVIGNKNPDELLRLLKAHFSCPDTRLLKIEAHKSGDGFLNLPVTSFFGRTRADIKIEDGCDRFCSYCVIPYARGRVRSKALEDIKKEAEALAANGFREIVLVGINLSAYGKGSDTNLCDAVEAAACVSGILRIRLGSLEPDHLTDEIVTRLSKTEKLCPQFHISLQSGCDKTLRAMNRHYNSAEYAELCKRLRASFYDCTLTTDVMVGFPGETAEDFDASLKFVKEIGFEKVHVFPYSPRGGTRAAEFDNQVESADKLFRAGEMQRAADKIRREFLASQVGRVLEVLTESKTENGLLNGYTANYTPVRFSGDAACGEIVKVKVAAADDDSCEGEIIN